MDRFEEQFSFQDEVATVGCGLMKLVDGEKAEKLGDVLGHMAIK